MAKAHVGFRLIVLSQIFVLGQIQAEEAGLSVKEAAQKTRQAKEDASGEVHTEELLKCRQAALGELKVRLISAGESKRRLAACDAAYPQSLAFIQCKRVAMKEHGNDPAVLNNALAMCRESLKYDFYSAVEPIPFFFKDGVLHFAGARLTGVVGAKELKLRDFDCSRPKNHMLKPETADYFLFGNHPSYFKGFAKAPFSRIESVLKIPKKIKPNGHFVAGVGKFYGNLKKKSGALYFPSSACVLESDLGAYFSGLSAYFLLDPVRKTFTPYAAIAFYRPDFKKLDKKALIKGLIDRFGSVVQGQLKALDQVKPNMIYLGVNEIAERDEEGDPRNVCKRSEAGKLDNSWLALIKTRADLKTPEFALVANVAALCKHGDSVSARL